LLRVMVVCGCTIVRAPHAALAARDRRTSSAPE
jgi:hypothetical protein